jgi:pectin methylesterase-like acyl-CoA thioesterase
MKHYFSLALGGFIGLLIVTTSFADTVTWTGAGSDQNWSTGNNWTNATAGTIGPAPGASDDVKFYDSTFLSANVDSGFGDTIASLHFGSTNSDYTVTAASGKTLNITGADGLRVGTPGDTSSAIARTVTFIGVGAGLNLNNPAANLVLNQGTALNANGSRAILDLQGLDTFTADLNAIGLGSIHFTNGVPQRNSGTLYLAKTNTITLHQALPLSTYLTNGAAINALEITYVGAGNPPGALSFLYLGQTNAFFVDSIGVGRSKSSTTSGATLTFNPALAAPTAYFRGIDGSNSRVTWWGIGDMADAASSAQHAVGTNDFTGGYVDALVETMSLGRDCGPNHTASGGTRVNTGVLTFDNGIMDVNTLIVGNQSLGLTTTSVTPNLGIVNVNGPNATLVVNNTLTLGNTTQTSPAAINTRGTLNISSGTVRANTITVGNTSTNNVISLSSGATLVVSNTVASPAKALTTLNVSDSTVQLQAGLSSPNVVVTNLITSGSGNTISIGPSPVLTAYPAQLVLIKYAGTIGGSGFNFTLGSVPAHVIGYLSNNTFNASVDLVVTTDPRPSIASTNQPLGLAVSPGETATFTVRPDGATPFSYRWQKNGADVSGANTDTLTIQNAQSIDAADYTVVITNNYGSVTSLVAHLTVSAGNVAPTLSQQPQNVAVTAGQDATFTVVAAGNPLPTYQWQKNGVNLTDSGNISGATSSSLTIIGAQPSDAASYSVGVTNIAGGILSSNATLTVNVPPALTTQPKNIKVYNGQPASFTVAASGSPAPTFQWRKNGAVLPDEIGPTLSFASVQPSDAGTYDATAINPAGSDTSTNVTLIVNSTMSATHLVPANDATNVCIDTPLQITFSVLPTIGSTGMINIYAADGSWVDSIDLSLNVGGAQARTIAGQSYNSYPVMISGNTATIYPHLGVLNYGQTYYVTVDNVVAGAFADGAGATFTGMSDATTWRFTTKTVGPDPAATNLVVAADGSGDFCTVQGAIDFVPAANTTPITVYIHNGVYQEINRINGKNNVTFLGEDRKQTIIAYPNNANLQPGGSTSTRIMFYAGGNDLVFANLTLTNSTPQGGSQAEALRAQGSRILIDNVDLDSYQDTLLINTGTTSSLYANKSLIQGQTDFIWGSGIGFFQSCEIKVLLNGVNTQARTPETTYGFIFADCTLSRANTNVNNHSLGRDANTSGPYGNVAYLNCKMDSHIIPAGWTDGGLADKSTLRFWEYQSTDLTGTNLISTGSRAAWSVQIDATQAAALRDLATVFNGWVLQLAPYIASQPVHQTAQVGQIVTIAAAVGGVPEPAYQWYKGNSTLSGATNETLVIASAQLSDAGTYSLHVTSPLGTVMSSNATLAVSSPVPPTISGITRLSDGNAQLSISSVGGPSYRVWASTNVTLTPVISTWTLLTNASFGSEPAIFTDSQATNFSQRFYLISVP